MLLSLFISFWISTSLQLVLQQVHNWKIWYLFQEWLLSTVPHRKGLMEIIGISSIPNGMLKEQSCAGFYCWDCNDWSVSRWQCFTVLHPTLWFSYLSQTKRNHVNEQETEPWVVSIHGTGRCCAVCCGRKLTNLTQLYLLCTCYNWERPIAAIVTWLYWE